MRFDYFKDFYETYKSELEKLGISKEQLKPIYETNFKTFRKTGTIKKHDFIDANAYVDVINGIEYCSFTKKNSVYLMPDIEKLTDSNKVGMFIGYDGIKILKTDENCLSYEKIDFNGQEVEKKLYDKEALEFIKEEGDITFYSADYLDDYLGAMHILPDASIDVIAYAEPTLSSPLKFFDPDEGISNTYKVNISVEKDGNIILADSYSKYNGLTDDNIYREYLMCLNNKNIDMEYLINKPNVK